MLDFELEFGVYLSGGNKLGQPMDVAAAARRLFGYALVNDWSARGVQFFESALGPFLGKSHLTTISPWIVTSEALSPFRCAATGRAPDEPVVLPYLFDADDQAEGGLDIDLYADLSTPKMRAAGTPAFRLVRTNFKFMFWTFAQMVAHQASNGCNLGVGDLVASGTASGPADDARACLVEITGRGATSIRLPNGETRTWLEDGDELTLRGRAARDGFVSIGFGDCAGRIEPAVAWPIKAAEAAA